MLPHIDVVVWTESKAASCHSTVGLSAFCNPLVIRSHQLLDGAQEESWLTEPLIQPLCVTLSSRTKKVLAWGWSHLSLSFCIWYYNILRILNSVFIKSDIHLQMICKKEFFLASMSYSQGCVITYLV